MPKSFFKRKKSSSSKELEPITSNSQAELSTPSHNDESSASGNPLASSGSEPLLTATPKLASSGPSIKSKMARSLSAQGSLANILPVLEDDDNKEGEENNSGAENGVSSSDSADVSLAAKPLLDGDALGGSTRSGLSLALEAAQASDGPSTGYERLELSNKTPGEIRTAVLEWMYEEKDADQCPYLTLSNITVLEDLILVFVSVVLHGKSEVIRGQVWRFLLQGSVNSLHFAFLTICSLNASSRQPNHDQVEDAESLDYKEKRTKDLAAIESIMHMIKDESMSRAESLAASSQSPQAIELKQTLETVMNQLESIHDNQVLTNLDLNTRGRSARQNIDMLVAKIRNAMKRDKSVSGELALKELDGRLGFVKTLTDLDEWLMRSVAREDRARILEEKLATLAETLPLGAYMPTAVEKGATQKHRVLRLVLEETIVFNTAHKCPFLLVAEVEPIVSEADRAALLERDARPKAPKESPRVVARKALEMVSTREFWQNPVKEIKHFKKRTTSEISLREFTVDEGDDEAAYLEGREADEAQENDALAAKEASKLSQERWEDLRERVRRDSPHGHLPGWQLASMFVKAGDDLRQQQLGVLFVSTFQKIFLEEGVPVWLSPYKVIPTGTSSGLLEPARNSDSIARIKQRGSYDGIDKYFLDKFGPKTSKRYQRAQQNFMQSLAGYSIVAYLIRLTDRHNGNILIDLDGHLMHIDFGFLLVPHGIERSPFKLTPDMVEILGGPYSIMFQKFRRLMEKAFIAANKHYREIILLAELLSHGESSSACFAGGRRWVIDEFKDRFKPGLTTRKLRLHINHIIDRSMYNYASRIYDKYQLCCNGIW